MRERQLGRRLLSVAWALSPLALAIPAAPSFLGAAWRLRERHLALEAVVYLAGTVFLFAAAGDEGGVADVAGGVGLATMAVATVRSFMLRRRVFGLEEASNPIPDVPLPVGWTPRFPGLDRRPVDLDDPTTWSSTFACTGHDRHELGLSPLRLIAFGISGGAQIALVLASGLRSGRALGAGVGMLLVPLIALAFKQELDGPSLRYRWWGASRELRLDSVGSVATSGVRGGERFLVLRSTGHRRVVRVAMRSHGHNDSAAVRDHIRGWVDRPGVEITPEAETALRTDEPAAPTPAPSTRRRLVALALAIAPLAVPVAMFFALREAGTHQPIPGAPGYVLYGGPHGKTIEVGRPWGAPCQPLLFAAASNMPDPVFAEIQTVISDARHRGINVTLAGRDDRWYPIDLYFPPGTEVTDTQRVNIYFDDIRKERPDGRLQVLDAIWNAELTPAGDHEFVTIIEATLHGPAIDDSFKVRRAARQLLALTQGIVDVNVADSGIRQGTDVDRLTASDLAAMRLMSGCGDDVGGSTGPR